MAKTDYNFYPNDYPDWVMIRGRRNFAGLCRYSIWYLGECVGVGKDYMTGEQAIAYCLKFIKENRAHYEQLRSQSNNTFIDNGHGDSSILYMETGWE